MAITACSPIWAAIGEVAVSKKNEKQQRLGKSLSLLPTKKYGQRIKQETQPQSEGQLGPKGKLKWSLVLNSSLEPAA